MTGLSSDFAWVHSSRLETEVPEPPATIERCGIVAETNPFPRSRPSNTPRCRLRRARGVAQRRRVTWWPVFRRS